MVFRLLAVLSFVLVILAPSANAQSPRSEWSVHVWRVNDGLPSNNLTGVAQSKDGYLWIATDRGIARFDGARFVQFSPRSICDAPTESLPRLVQSHSGGVIIANDVGLVGRLRIGLAPQVLSTGLTSAHAVSICEDVAGTIWVGYHFGPIMRLQDGKAVEITTADGIPSQEHDCYFVEAKDARLWFCQGSAIGVVDKSRFNVLAHMPQDNTRIAAAREGGIWAYSGGQLFRCRESGEVEARGSLGPKKTNLEAYTLLEDRTGAVWLATKYEGLMRFNGTDFENVPTSHERIICLTEDTEGNLWAGTGGGGLNRVQPRVVTIEGAAVGFGPDAIRSICQDSSGALWCATRDGSLRLRAGEGWKKFTEADGWPGGGANCVLADPRGGIWVGTRDYRLVRLDQGKITTWQKQQGVAARNITNMLVARNGDLWLESQSPDVIQRFRGDFKTFKAPSSDVRHFRGLVEDASGDIWAGADNGSVYRIHGDEFIDETSRFQSAFSSVRTLFIGPDNVLWIGTGRDGLGRFDIAGARLSMIKESNGLYDNCISQMVMDTYGWMWFGGRRGIFKIRQQELNDAAQSRGTNVQSVHYGEYEQVPSLETTFASGANALRTADGRIWMLMGTALAIISPGSSHEQLQPPPVLLERLAVDDTTAAEYGSVLPVDAARDLAKAAGLKGIRAGHHRIRFDFTALSFDAPNNVRFQYRLDGVDDGWNETTLRSISYSRLPAGSYYFRVRACNGAGVWNEVGAVAQFSVAPFVWQTWWFRALAVAGFTGIVGLAARYISLRRMRAQLAALEQRNTLYKERVRIARDLHDDLGHGLTQIVLLSDQANQEHPRSAKLQRISATARQGVKSLDETVWAINPRNDTLSDVIDYIGHFAMQSLCAAEIECELDLPEQPPARQVPSEARHALFLVVKEAVNNIIRHSGASNVQLTIGVVDNSLTISIADNGTGACPAVAGAGQDGLRNMRQRMHDIGGAFSIDSTPGAGTRISLLYRWMNGNGDRNGNGNGREHPSRQSDHANYSLNR